MKVEVIKEGGTIVVMEIPDYTKVILHPEKGDDIIVYSVDSNDNIKHSMETDNEFNVVIEINRGL